MNIQIELNHYLPDCSVLDNAGTTVPYFTQDKHNKYKTVEKNVQMCHYMATVLYQIVSFLKCFDVSKGQRNFLTAFSSLLHIKVNLKFKLLLVLFGNGFITVKTFLLSAWPPIPTPQNVSALRLQASMSVSVEDFFL